MSDEPTGMMARIAEVLRQNPEGLTSGEIREKLGLAANEQSQLDKRRRDLRKWYTLIVVQGGKYPRYQLGEKNSTPRKAGNVNSRLRAEVLRACRGTCQMCGKTVVEDGVKLQIDHKIPQDWGGLNDIENLWALCEPCNHGKKNLFSSQSDETKSVLKHKSIHVRIGELLKLNFGGWVPAQLIDFVANQDDWKKRTRELRYLGWNIETKRERHANGRVRSFYRVMHYTEWPENPSQWLQNYEKERGAQNRLLD
jgi:5-methylcytosine-specific restriction endonuclease McrA